jgi:phage terminase large subunit-like protein
MELDNLIEDFFCEEYKYDTTNAYIRIDFIEHCVKLTKAPFYGKPMQLLLWQKALIEVAYSFKIKSLDTNEWVDRFQEILLIIARKCGKTELIAALELTEMILGKPGSDIVCSGTNDGTADLCYQAIDTMRLIIDPQSVDTWRNQKGIKCFETKNSIYKLSDSSRQKEGRNIDFAGIDEVWSLADDGIYKPIQQSTSTKESYKIFMFGSEGFVADGFLDNQTKKYRKIIRKEDATESSKRKLPWIYSMDDEREVWDTNEDGINPLWEKANPSIGVIKKWSYLRDRVDEARQSKSDKMFVLAKDFNFKVSNGQAWLNREDYEYITNKFDLEDFRGSIILGAVDLSETTDMSNAKILLMKKNDKTKYIYTHYWIPESKLELSNDIESGAKYSEWARKGLLTICEGNEIDVSNIADWFYQLYKDYGLKLYKCGYDQRYAKDFLNKMEEYNFECEMIYQNKFVMSPPMKLVEADFTSKLINYNQNEIDKWCLQNIGVLIDDLGYCMPVKQKEQKSKRIDGAVVFIILYEVFRRYRSDFLNNLKE